MVQRFLSEIGKNYFTNKEGLLRRKKIETDFREKTLTEMIKDARKNESPSIKENTEQKQKTTREVIKNIIK